MSPGKWKWQIQLVQSVGNDELCCFIPTLELHVCIHVAEENCTSRNCKKALLQPHWNASTAWECWRSLASCTNPLSSSTFGGMLHFRIRPQLSNSLCASDQRQFLFVSISEIVSTSESASVSTFLASSHSISSGYWVTPHPTWVVLVTLSPPFHLSKGFPTVVWHPGLALHWSNWLYIVSSKSHGVHKSLKLTTDSPDCNYNQLYCTEESLPKLS